MGGALRQLLRWRRIEPPSPRGNGLCTGFQAELDAISDIGGFADAPWMPGELRGVVETALGCQWFPDRPEDVYRYP